MLCSWRRKRKWLLPVGSTGCCHVQELFPVLLPSAAGCGCARHPEFVTAGRTGRVGAISCWRESVLDPGTRLRFVSCHKHLGSWMQEILPLGMWSTGELSCVGTWLTHTPWTVGIIHPPPPQNPLQTESLPSPASAPSGAPTNLIILNLVLFSRSSI